MEISTDTQGQTSVVRVSGRVDEQGAETMKASLGSLSLSGISEVQIDFKGLTYIGSSGIGKLLLFYKNIGVQQIRLKVINVPTQIYDLLLELKLNTVFTIEK